MDYTEKLIMGMKKILFLLLIISNQAILAEDECRVDIKEYLAYPEEYLPRLYWPYQSLSSDEVNNHYYALFHETIYEQEESGTPNEKICDGCISMTEDIDVFLNISNHYLMIDMPDSSGTHWKFHDGRQITGEDIKASIQLAKSIGLLTEGLFGKITINEWGDIKISLNGNPPLQSIAFQLLKVKIIPAHYTKYVGNEYQANIKDPLMRKYFKEPIGAGPFEWSKRLQKCIILNKSYEYINYNPSEETSLQGIKITLEPMKVNHPQRLEESIDTKVAKESAVNLVMNLPYSLAKDLMKKEENLKVVTVISQSVNKIIFNYHSVNKHLNNKYFREAIIKGVDRKDIFIKRLKNQGTVLSGPWFKSSPKSCLTIFPHEYKKNANEIIINNIPGYTLEQKRSKKILKYDGERVSLTIIYPKETTTVERDAIGAIIKDIKRLGIEVSVKTITKISWNEILKGNHWDLAYTTETQDVASSVAQQYECNGNQNYSGYCNENLDESFDQEKRQPLDRKISCDIHDILHNDYVSMFLWNSNKMYAFNRKILYENSVETNSYDFFSNPENWHLKK